GGVRGPANGPVWAAPWFVPLHRPTPLVGGTPMSAIAAEAQPPKTIEHAKRQFVELYGGPLVLNTYLKIAVVFTTLLAIGLLWLNFRTQAQYANLKPIVIRIDGVGRAEAVAYDTTTYRPQAPEF